MCFDPLEAVIAAFGSGEVVILTDDAGRENEGDLIVAGCHATPEAVNCLITHGRGLLCVPMAAAWAARLNLVEPVSKHDLFNTAFTQSVDVIAGNTTGISAFDRARTIKALSDPASTLEDFYSPGHVFPLIARPGGVLERDGHTEGVVELATLAGLPPVGVLCEILNPDGSMARLPDLELLKQRLGLKMTSIADLIACRRRHSESA